MLSKEKIEILRKHVDLEVHPDIQKQLRDHEVINTKLKFGILERDLYLKVLDHAEALHIAVEALKIYRQQDLNFYTAEEALRKIEELVGGGDD